MKLSFTRSGGFAGPATALKGEVTFEGDSARVTSDFGYRRDLHPRRFRLCARPSCSFRWSSQYPVSSLTSINTMFRSHGMTAMCGI